MPNTVAQVYNPSTQEGEKDHSKIHSQLGLHNEF